uniref:Ribosomal protein L6 n=2 Tax=Pavlovaceae TaxID=418969 RepID=M1K000_DIALT|nr:ribosomal protein L6 [Diacronema lutheri]YP_009863759.1 ribosomal protein L6 [Pavlova sp. NIVA-4/92]AGE93737.1 ribosomal protein L6 [Diacronema lutheri]QKE31090.1 ribosomal protein L6 [Pavlova sp. NIVA-4/92]|mmetsp:Transcript_11229/g.35449  ORF Transcript_11229/g.35449 Transcript_11229/m.35449 type:complete len:180 (+) Transcript_11229:5620-6159(+)
MSRIGRLPIKIPSDISVEFAENNILLSKSNLKHTIPLPSSISYFVDEGFLYLKLNKITKDTLSLYGLTRSLIANSIIGISEGFTRTLDIQGVGYRSQIDGKNLVLFMGYSHKVIIAPPEGVTFTVEANTTIQIKGSKKDIIGEIAANIRSVRPPEPYKGKGIRYRGEVVRRKVGKGGKK